MKTSHIALCAALLAAASAPTLAADEASRGSPQRVEISAAADATRAAQVVLALRELDTVYEMSTGRALQVSGDGATLRVRYGRRPTMTLTHDGRGGFVSADGQFELQFRLDATGEPQLVRLTLPARLA